MREKNLTLRHLTALKVNRLDYPVILFSFLLKLACYNAFDMKLPFTVKVFVDESSKDAPWIAYNPELDVASCGPSEKKARQNLKEAIDIVLIGAKKDGNLEDLLKNSGFTVKDGAIEPPKIVIENVPFPSL